MSKYEIGKKSLACYHPLLPILMHIRVIFTNTLVRITVSSPTYWFKPVHDKLCWTIYNRHLASMECHLLCVVIFVYTPTYVRTYNCSLINGKYAIKSRLKTLNEPHYKFLEPEAQAAASTAKMDAIKSNFSRFAATAMLCHGFCSCCCCKILYIIWQILAVIQFVSANSKRIRKILHLLSVNLPTTFERPFHSLHYLQPSYGTIFFLLNDHHFPVPGSTLCQEYVLVCA